ncbi:MAG: carbohydrate ABC transporter permease [Candidatus Atribacteria bacterium]|nr:carbohydrate ABC transporter permease [Candidatus Atribacteria bacterium]
MKQRKKLNRLVFWYAIVAVLLLFALFPIYWMFITSFKTFQDIYLIFPKLWPGKIEWKNYLEIFTRYNYGIALKNSIKVSLGVSILSILSAIFSAYCVIRLKFRGRKSIPQFVLFSYLIPRTILFIPVYILVYRLGLGNTTWGLLLVYPTITIPYATWVLITYFQSFPFDIEEAAWVDGASRLQTLFRIILPISLPSVIATFIFSFTLCWSEYIYALVMINTKAQKTITLALSDMLVADIIPWGPLMAGAVVAALPAMIIYTLASRYIVSGLSLGAVKE